MPAVQPHILRLTANLFFLSFFDPTQGRKHGTGTIVYQWRNAPLKRSDNAESNSRIKKKDCKSLITEEYIRPCWFGIIYQTIGSSLGHLVSSNCVLHAGTLLSHIGHVKSKVHAYQKYILGTSSVKWSIAVWINREPKSQMSVSLHNEVLINDYS